MISIKALLAATLLIAWLSGCAGTPFKWNDARSIQPGMTKTEVTEKLGAPNRISTTASGGTRYIWVWVNTMSGTSRTLLIDFDKAGKVVKAPPIPDEFQD